MGSRDGSRPVMAGDWHRLAVGGPLGGLDMTESYMHLALLR